MKSLSAALAFKIATDPFVGRLCFFRVYSGKLDAGSYVFNTRTEKKERISRIFQMHSNKQNPIELIRLELEISEQVLDLKILELEILYVMRKLQLVLESMTFPDPVIGIAIEPKDSS